MTGCGERGIDGSVLDGVSETMLWTLRNKAVEAERSNGYFSDPLSVQLYRAIAYRYERFGKPSQSHPLRAMAFDTAIRSFLAAHPGGTVVALGEGLQTSFWRIADPDVRWYSVDLPVAASLRKELLPREPNLTTLAGSALERDWMDRLEVSGPVFVSAEGLLMYFTPEQAVSLITDCAARFPGGQMIFDSIPAWFSAKTLKGLKLGPGYTAPPMPFHLSVSAAVELPNRIPNVESATDVRLPLGRGLWGGPLGRILWRLFSLPKLRDHRPSITLLQFGTGT
ncbi:MAG: class I SAM-dependent methyltransferase [Pseudonocardiaceae bacterium]